MGRANPRSHIDTETLKRERSLADLVASYGIALKREGSGRYRALCPFHEERTPSFWIDARDDHSQHYFCFGCSAHGDVLTFVMDRENCSFLEACERLSARGRPPQVDSTPLPARRQPGGRVWEELDSSSREAQVLDAALRIYEEQLWHSEHARTYLRRRGIPEDVARAQRLGYADGRGLLAHLRRSAEQEDLACAVRLGLVLERPGPDDSDTIYREFFSDRLIVPELRGGRPIWMIGRALEHSEVEMGAHSPESGSARAGGRVRPKYLGLPGEKPVIGLERAAGGRSAFIVEGPLDWIAAVNWNLPAFAICGTHFPAARLPALESALAVYGVFDPDRAGQSAAERFAPLFGSRWRPVRLPNKLDLAEVAALGEAGREIFKVAVGRARAAAWRCDRG